MYVVLFFPFFNVLVYSTEIATHGTTYNSSTSTLNTCKVKSLLDSNQHTEIKLTAIELALHTMYDEQKETDYPKANVVVYEKLETRDI